MIRKISIIALIAFFTFPINVIGETVINDSLPSLQKEKYQVFFVQSVSPQEALEVLKNTVSDIVSINHKAMLGNELTEGGYFVQTQDTKAILEDYRNSYLGFLNDLANSANQNTVLDPMSKTAQNNHNTNIKVELAKEDPFKAVQVESVIISGNNLIAHDLLKLSKIRDVKAISEIFHEKQIIEHKNTNVELQINGIDPTKWVPAQGTSYIHPSSAGGRYVQQNMYWNSWWNVSGFGINSTYEHDFFLYNYDNRTYLSSNQAANGIPTVSYWTSNLPRPYLDTRFGDPSGEKAYTIGSANGLDIWPFNQYWYYIRTPNGNTSVDTGKINAQLGYRNPSWCYTTWCSFQDPNTPIYRLILAWNISAPGTKNWNR